jgi:hypothetical protein
MTNTYVRLSKPIDPARAETLVRVARIAADKRVAFGVVGASCRAGRKQPLPDGNAGDASAGNLFDPSMIQGQQQEVFIR